MNRITEWTRMVHFGSNMIMDIWLGEFLRENLKIGLNGNKTIYLETWARSRHAELNKVAF